ncbi:GerAB/ArcD/ProY family transporter [Desulforamulus hydrothermalis]|uniref:Spore germination protein n=1 Tax=Desulforamulus hydrothermalis Lam5 = DSM 18033 TaxID=1121428 RepID=K8DXL7_9FIRM|nr:endospore germination permease [Desulforamulus hydrothermalis]CCO07310.1 Spore germination protein [Desulforamulus hydrothermalis Lam5 = DSM 18033]SHG93763.1 spore germination protein (amino acid permease) [Desulforamulus hydrothermalis Lam5 = DSM 18033]
MSNENNLITSKQLIFTIISALIGVGILTLTSTVAREARQDAWISLIIGALVPLLGLFTINLIGSRFPRLTFAEYAEKIIGKWPGKLLALIFVLYTLVFAGIVIRIFVDILKIYFFPLTPVWALGGLIIFVAAYLASQSAQVVVRVNELMFYESLLLIAFAVGAMPQIDITFFQPVGEAGWEQILKGAYKTMFAFLGLEILLVYYPLVQRKNEIIKAGITALGIVFVIYLMIVVTVMGVFGPDVSNLIRFGFMVLIKTYQTPVVERGEFFFIIFWVFVSFRPAANLLFTGRYSLEKILGVKAPAVTTLIMYPFILFACLLPRNFEQVLDYSTYVSFVGMAYMLGVPLLLLIIARWRGLDGDKNYANT